MVASEVRRRIYSLKCAAVRLLTSAAKILNALGKAGKLGKVLPSELERV